MFNCYARLLGASVGRDADVATMYFTDHDLVSKLDGWVSETICRNGVPGSLFRGTVTPQWTRAAFRLSSTLDFAVSMLVAVTKLVRGRVVGCSLQRSGVVYRFNMVSIRLHTPSSNSPPTAPTAARQGGTYLILSNNRPSGACGRCPSETERWYRKTASRTRRCVCTPAHVVCVTNVSTTFAVCMTDTTTTPHTPPSRLRPGG